jgi:hypothetical protein
MDFMLITKTGLLQFPAAFGIIPCRRVEFSYREFAFNVLPALAQDRSRLLASD